MKASASLVLLWVGFAVARAAAPDGRLVVCMRDKTKAFGTGGEDGEVMMKAEFAALLPVSAQPQPLESKTVITRAEAMALLWRLLVVD